MKRVAVFFGSRSPALGAFDDPIYLECYTELAKAIAYADGQFLVVRGYDSYEGSMTFRGGWAFEGSEFVRFEERVTVDVIFNKDGAFEPTPDAVVVNAKELDRLCANKRAMYELFPSLFPLTIPVSHPAGYTAAVDRIPSRLVVLKPLLGYGGKGVRILTKQEALDAKPEVPLIVQAFLDMSDGIPGIVDGHHDFRIVVINGRVLSTSVRVPALGKFISNVSQGGTMLHVPPEKRPPEAMAFVEKIDPTFARFGHRLYSIDLGRDAADSWKIIELNDHPGIQTRKESGGGAAADAYYREFAEFLLTAATTAPSGRTPTLARSSA